MIAALILGRQGSVGFPGKNTMDVLGHPLMAYPLMAANESKYVDKVFVSTDSPEIKAIGERHGAIYIERPAELCTKTALGEDAYRHGYNWIKEHYPSEEIELLVLLFCNAPTISGALIDEGIEALRSKPEIDSAVTVSVYNMWSPLRARKLDKDGLLIPFVPFETFGDPKTLNCDRDSQGDVFFADMGTSIVRPRCFEHMEDGLLPQKWMGKKIYPIKNWGGLDVDFEFQVPQAEFWIKKKGKK